MHMFCQDRDLLLIEPGVFTRTGFGGQVLAAGTDGGLVGTSFTSSSADFESAGVAAGGVLRLQSGALDEGMCCEVIARISAETLTVSIARPGLDEPAVAPQAGSGDLTWRVLSFSPQIAAASGLIAEQLRSLSETEDADVASFVDSSTLRAATAAAALAAVFAAASETADPADARWSKHLHHQRQFHQRMQRLRLARDVDGDGAAEQTRSLANVRLRRL